MHFTNDPIADYDRYLAEQEEAIERLPKCEICGEPITEEYAVYYNDTWVCRDCEHDFWDNIREDFLQEVRE